MTIHPTDAKLATVGGIPTKYTGEVLTIDEDGKDKVVPGLYAAGEAACVSVHGANRLGANSLLDIVVFGRACAHHIKDTLTPGKPHRAIPEEAGIKSIEFLDQIRFDDSAYPMVILNSSGLRMVPNQLQIFVLRCKKLCNLMQRYFGVCCRPNASRLNFTFSDSTQKSLDEGVEAMRAIYSSFAKVGIKDRSMIWNSFVFRSLCECAVEPNC